MRDPVVHQEGNARVGDEVCGLLGGRVCGHDDCWVRREGCFGEIGVVHEGDMRGRMGREGACCEMKL